MFREHSKPVRQACLGLIIGGFLFGLIAGMGIYLGITGTLTSFGKFLTAYCVFLTVMGLTAGFLLADGLPQARPIAWTAAFAFLIFIPLGTIVALIVSKRLSSPEMTRHLDSSWKTQSHRKSTHKRNRTR